MNRVEGTEERFENEGVTVGQSSNPLSQSMENHLTQASQVEEGLLVSFVFFQATKSCVLGLGALQPLP